MSDETKAAGAGKSEYEPPKIDEVVTANDLEREVQYAGSIVGSGAKF